MVETIARTAGAAALSVMLMCASDATEGHNEAQGPPGNLQAGAYRTVVRDMWRDSPAFRRQGKVLADVPWLTVQQGSQNFDRLIWNFDPGAPLEELARTDVEREGAEARLTRDEAWHGGGAQVYAQRRFPSTSARCRRDSDSQVQRVARRTPDGYRIIRNPVGGARTA